jgi:hypothetical protein
MGLYIVGSKLNGAVKGLSEKETPGHGDIYRDIIKGL